MERSAHDADRNRVESAFDANERARGRRMHEWRASGEEGDEGMRVHGDQQVGQGAAVLG